jgi:hypothetical protein
VTASPESGRRPADAASIRYDWEGTLVVGDKRRGMPNLGSRYEIGLWARNNLVCGWMLDQKPTTAAALWCRSRRVDVRGHKRQIAERHR